MISLNAAAPRKVCQQPRRRPAADSLMRDISITEPSPYGGQRSTPYYHSVSIIKYTQLFVCDHVWILLDNVLCSGLGKAIASSKETQRRTTFVIWEVESGLVGMQGQFSLHSWQLMVRG